MSLRDSDSDLGGRLGALTPQLRGARAQEPVENSGLVDMRALYAASVEQVMQRAQAARARPPVVAFEPIAVDQVAVDEEPIVLRRRGLGCLPITFLVLGVAAAGGLFVANSNVPAVMHAKATLAPSVIRAKTIAVGVAMRAETAVVARVDRLLGRPLPVALPLTPQPPEALPLAPAVLPVAAAPSPPSSQVDQATPPATVVDAKPAPAAPPARTPVSRGHALPKGAADVRSTTHAPKRPGSTSSAPRAVSSTRAPAADEAPEPAPVKAAAEPAKAQAPAGGADSKPMSLDDMIRRAVEAESKRKP